MYEQLTWHFPESNEVSIIYAGNYGAKGEKRSPRKKPTPEQLKKQNQKNKENKVRRKIKLNFNENDLWITLKYPAGERKNLQELNRDYSNFIKKLRRRYQKRGAELKWICRKEIGKNGGLHIHLLINRIQDADILVTECWPGRTWHTNIYESGGYRKLAEYIVKQPDEEVMKQLSLFPEEEQDQLIAYSCSRNLAEPVPEKKTYSRRTVRKMLEEGPKPTPGYEIDKNSIVQGVNPFTGMSYLHYTEYRVKHGTRKHIPRGQLQGDKDAEGSSHIPN